MKKGLVLLCVMCFVLGGAGAVRAQDSVEAVSFTPASGTFNSSAADIIVGYSFIPGLDMTVTDLGFYYLPFGSGSSLTDTFEVGIFENDGDHLISETIYGPGTAFEFIYNEVAETLLSQGTEYWILANCGNRGYEFNVQGFSAPGISITSNLQLSEGAPPLSGDLGTGFKIEVDTFPLTGFLGPNFKYEVTEVPIPGAVWLLGSGLFGLMGLRRRNKKA